MQAQYVRMFREQGQQAAILNNRIDVHFISFMEYKEQGTKFARIDSDIGDAMKDGEKAGDTEKILAKFKAALGDTELTVEAEPLKTAETPAVMLLSEYSRRMQEMSRDFGEAFSGAKPEESLVLNLANPVVQAIPSLNDENARIVCRHVYDLARLGHRQLSADEMSAFIGRSVQILGILAGVQANLQKDGAPKAQPADGSDAAQ